MNILRLPSPRATSVRAWLAALCLFITVSLSAQSAGEKVLFDAAIRAFQDGFYELAEKDFGEIIRLYPKSERLSEITQLRDLSAAETSLKLGDYGLAADRFAQFVTQYTNSARRLDAVLGEAVSRARLGESQRVLDLLTPAESPFQTAAKATPEDARVWRGHLLIAEAQLKLNHQAEAITSLVPLEGRNLPPLLAWQRYYLMGRAQSLSGQYDAAWLAVTNLPPLAAALGSINYSAETVALQADILQKRNQPVEARQLLEQNLSTNVPPIYRRAALFKVVDSLRAEKKPTEAAQRLESFLQEPGQGGTDDLSWLTLGELKLQQYYTLPAAAQLNEGTNLLSAALAYLDRVITNNTAMEYLGKAYFSRGWSWWEESERTKSPEAMKASRRDFEQAVARLPRSEEQAVALFKVADSQYATGEVTEAITNYQAVISNYADIASVKSGLFDQALYQIVRAGVQTGALPVAEEALKKLLESYPESFYADRGSLLYGQALNRKGNPAEAIKHFQEFVAKFPQSNLMPEVRLGLARAFEYEEKWPEAIAEYDTWLNTYTNHVRIPQATYFRGLAYQMSGSETNALNVFTDFLQRFPTNNLGALAQNWVADFYYSRSRFQEAEENYQKLYQSTNWPLSELQLQAQLMAGRSAYSRQSFKDARAYFTGLINKLNEMFTEGNRPPGVSNARLNALLNEAWFVLGDAIVEEPVVDPAKPLDKFREAIEAFNRIPSTNSLSPSALGRIGSCYLQLAATDPNQYTNAISAFQAAMNAPQAHISTRSLAEIGLGTVYERQAAEATTAAPKAQLTEQALTHYLQVYYKGNLRAGEQEDLYMQQQAGLAAAQLAEKMGRLQEAANVYRGLMEAFPPLRARLERRLQLLAQRQAAAN